MEDNFKMLFVNTQTLSKPKISFLISLLTYFNVIFLSEVNYKQQLLSDIPLELCQTHFDPETPRLAMLCTHSTKFEYKGIGLKLDQIRVQNDQTIVQTNLYRIIFENNMCLEAENTYVTPDIHSDKLVLTKQHFTRQSNKQISYVAGGDFNINWYNSSKKKKFKIHTLTQNIKSATRIKHTKNSKGNDRTSKTMIDLIFSNQKMDSKIVGTEVHKMETNNEQIKFDHFGVSVCTNYAVKHKYRDVRIPYDPFRRQNPTESQFLQISNEIEAINCENNYDTYMMELKVIFDKYIPEHRKTGFYTKRFYDVPYSKEIRDAIKLKHNKRIAYKLNPCEETLRARNFQRNLVTNLTRNFKKDYQSALLSKSADLHSVKHVYKTLEILKISGNHHKNKSRIVIDGHFGTGLANHMAKYFKTRAEDLVNTDSIENSPDLYGCIQDHEIPETTLEAFHFPPITDIKKVIPPKKTTRTGSMDTISGAVLVNFWEQIQPKMNEIFEESNLSYPETNQGYLQRIISKSDSKQPEILKDMRPLGVLNTLPKYHMSAFVFTLLRDHVKPIFINRKNYTYHGCRLPIIDTLDTALIQVQLGFFTAVCKYDFSNAFGTIYQTRLDQVVEQLNVGVNIRQFILGYFYHQNYCQTIFEDPISGIHVSEITSMSKGGPQGQVGMDVCFSIQQFGLSPADDIGRNNYMDDLNDNILNCKTRKEATNLAIENDVRLNNQSITVGFAKNESKTTFIPVNMDKQDFLDAGIDEEQILSKSGILGFNFEFKNGKLDVFQASKDIISSLNQHLRAIHSTRTYLPNQPVERLKIARTCIYYHLLFLPLIYAYGETPLGVNRAFDQVLVKINDLIRATGLVRTTPREILNQCLGTSVVDFVKQQIICDGLKQLQFSNCNPFGRLNKIRSSGRFCVHGTFMNKFRTIWNDLDTDSRNSFLEMDITAVKAELKRRRTLAFNPTIYDQYKWIDLSLGI